MENTTLKQPITVTEKAIKEIKHLMGANHLSPSETVLRVGVKGGGCSGLSYHLNFDARTSEHDQVFEVDGIRVAVDAKSVLYLYGTTLDFGDMMSGGGFKFINPNAKQSCGCGSSFTA